MSEATALLCEERGKLRKKMINAQKNQLLRGQHKIKNRACKAAVKPEIRTLLENEILKMKEDFKNNRSHNLFKTVRNLGKKSRKKYMVMKDKVNKKIDQKNEILKVWEKLL